MAKPRGKHAAAAPNRWRERDGAKPKAKKLEPRVLMVKARGVWYHK